MRGISRSGVGAGFAIVVAIGCLGAPAAAQPGAATSARSACTGKAVRGAFGAFVRSFNRGEFERLDKLFAQQPEFEWFSDHRPGNRFARRAKRRRTLIPYLRSRRRSGERLGLRSFRFNGNSPRWGNFEMTVRRRIPRYRRGGWFRVNGKGAAICGDGKVEFIVMSYGDPEPLRPRATARARS